MHNSNINYIIQAHLNTMLVLVTNLINIIHYSCKIEVEVKNRGKHSFTYQEEMENTTAKRHLSHAPNLISL